MTTTPVVMRTRTVTQIPTPTPMRTRMPTRIRTPTSVNIYETGIDLTIDP
jgi:hypothetical protein